jgi:hypothetical protein
MNAPFDTCLEACTQLVNPVGLMMGITSCDEEKNFGEELLPSFPDPNWTYSRALVKS